MLVAARRKTVRANRAGDNIDINSKVGILDTDTGYFTYYSYEDLVRLSVNDNINGILNLGRHGGLSYSYYSIVQALHGDLEVRGGALLYKGMIILKGSFNENEVLLKDINNVSAVSLKVPVEKKLVIKAFTPVMRYIERIGSMLDVVLEIEVGYDMGTSISVTGASVEVIINDKGLVGVVECRQDNVRLINCFVNPSLGIDKALMARLLLSR